MGIAWDGDFDRCFLFDEQGGFIEGYYIVGLLAESILKKHPGSSVVHDPRLTWNTLDIVETVGGKAVQSKSGHSFIKEKMREALGLGQQMHIRFWKWLVQFFWIEPQVLIDYLLGTTFSEGDLRVISLRYFNPIGAHPSGRLGEDPDGIPNNLMPYVMQVAVGKLPELQIFGDDYDTPDGTGVRDYIHVTDLACAHLEALTYLREKDTSNIFNCGYSKGYSVLEVVEAIKRVSGVDLDARLTERRPGDPAAIVAASTKIRRTLGWTPQHDNLEKIVSEALSWEERLTVLKAS